MRTLLVKIKYDGSGFCGWQVQDEKRTVQEIFQQTLWDVLKENSPWRSMSSSRPISPPLTVIPSRTISTRATTAWANSTAI